MDALLPISLGNQRFSSRNLEVAVQALPTDVSALTFLIADSLQLYNRVSMVERGEQYAEILKRYRYLNSESADRKRWLRRLRSRVADTSRYSRWAVKSAADYADNHLMEIFRNVLLAFHTVSQFRRDVEEAAKSYYLTRRTPPTATDLRLSELYIVEEIALNVRVRVTDGLSHEFYLGTFHEPLINVYRKKYGFDTADLAGRVGMVDDFRFYSGEWANDVFAWRECGAP